MTFASAFRDVSGIGISRRFHLHKTNGSPNNVVPLHVAVYLLWRGNYGHALKQTATSTTA
ncbi:hypothetical protein JOE11_002345 [Robbsia andropogonis]